MHLLELRCMRCMRCMRDEVDEVHEVHLVLGHFSPRISYLKIALKSDFFDFFQTICFWKAETELEINLFEFLGSEVI